MPELRPIAVGPDRLPVYLEALTAMLEGSGPALLPYPAEQPEPDVPDGPLPDDLGLVVSTSGSTGVPKRAALTRANLVASAEATHARLGGPGQWLLAMPAHHIAGTQVLIRSVVARIGPALLNLAAGFDPVDLTDALAWMPPSRRYTALVPTQLARVLDDPDSTEALTTFAGVLIGGAASPPALLDRARRSGVQVVTTYGMSETAGGCVYDGVPLDGTSIVVDDDGRVGLAGPTVAAGYLGDDERTTAAFDIAPTGERRFWTDDLGEIAQGRLRILGRRDDVIVTGGLKVTPRIVEDAALDLPGVREAVAVATPDAEWGQAVSLALVADRAWSVAALRDALRHALPDYALPQRALMLDTLPTRGPGKPDRGAIARSPQWQNRATAGFDREKGDA